MANKILNHLKKVYSKFYKYFSKQKVRIRYKDIFEILNNTKNQKRILLIGTSVYGNYGDQAISEAEEKLLKDIFKEEVFIEIPVSMFTFYSCDILKSITKKDLIILNGGGYLGSLWPEGQNVVDKVLKNKNENKIIIFPQTIFYAEGMSFLIEEHNILFSNAGNNLTVFLRDLKSYDFFKKTFKNVPNLHLIPDIVTTLNNQRVTKPKNHIVLCLRNDKEKIHSNRSIKEIINKYNLNEKYEIILTDSVVNETIDLFNRKEKLDSFLNVFKDAKLVITDRLHGLILSAICGVPVIGFDNVSGKVKGASDWFKKTDFVKFIDDIDENTIEFMLNNSDKFIYDNSIFKNEHQLLKETILDVYNEIQE